MTKMRALGVESAYALVDLVEDHRGDAAPLRLVAPPGRRHLDGLGDHRGQADGPEGDLGLAGDELLEPPHGARPVHGRALDDLQPPAQLDVLDALEEAGIETARPARCRSSSAGPGQVVRDQRSTRRKKSTVIAYSLSRSAEGRSASR